MIDAGGTGAEDDLSRCTSVLLSVPREIASRIESFLRANDIPCRIRLNTEMTPERLAEEYLRSSGRDPSGLLDAPILGPLLRGRLGRDLKAEIKVVGSELPPMWDVLVRPEDQHDAGDHVAAGGETTPAMAEPETGATSVAGATPAGHGPVVLCELAWDDAWRLIERLSAAGIPAAVMEGEGGDRDRPMNVRTVPVGVRPEDLERAGAFIE
jgi:hypothetical protein